MTAQPAIPALERCDPGGVIRAALTGPPQPGLRDLWLGWVIRLPVEIDAAEAATALLDACPGEHAPEELRGLLLSTARCSRTWLAQVARGRGRAGRNAIRPTD
jgi:hypothetical protein